MQVWWGKPFTGSVDAIKYSPCGRYLAAGSHDREIDIFDCDQGYSRRCRCSGHSSSVEHFDWARDGSALQSNDQAYEVRHLPIVAAWRPGYCCFIMHSSLGPALIAMMSASALLRHHRTAIPFFNKS